MQKLRSICYFVYFQISLLLYASFFCLTAWMLARRLRYPHAAVWCRMVVYGARWIGGIRWRVDGLETIPDQPVIFLCKHQSTWETLALPFIMNRYVCFVHKKELYWIPLFGWALALLPSVAINRARATVAMRELLTEGCKRLQEGVSIIVFPEGTRTESGQVSTYLVGGARLAQEASVPVVPVAIASAKCWPAKSWALRPGEITVRVGPAIASEGLSAREINNRAHEWIEFNMRELESQTDTIS